MESSCTRSEQLQDEGCDSARGIQDDISADEEWSMAQQCLSVFTIEVFQCRLCSSFHSTQKTIVTEHLKEKHPAEWLILKDVNNVSLLHGGSRMNTLNQGDLEQMVERELIDGHHTKLCISTNQKAVGNDSSVISSSNNSDGTETPKTHDSTVGLDRSSEIGELVSRTSQNNVEMNEAISVKKDKRKRRQPRSSTSSPKADSTTSHSARDASETCAVRETLESSTLCKDVDLVITKSPPRSGLRGTRKPRVYKDFVVEETSQRRSSSGDNCNGEEPAVEGETSWHDFPSEQELAFHCELCEFQTPSASSLKIHLRRSHDIASKKRKCPTCLRRFVSERGLQRHRQLKNCTGMPARNKSEELVQCDQCEFKTTSLIGLKIHSHTHKEQKQKSFPCQLCSRTFTSLKGAKLHETLRCGSLRIRKSNVLKCTRCGKTCTNKKTFTEHLSTHSQIRSHKCNLCPKTYKTMTSLLRHQNKHRDKFYHCNECNFKSRWQSSLKTHLTTMHIGNKNLQYANCSLCDFKTTNKFYLKRHMVTHSEDRPFICEICGKASKSEQTLKIHMETHQSIAYPCTKCDYVGRTRMAIYSHRVVHMSREERNYKCDCCNWVGKRKSELTMHYRKHSTERMYQCGHCGKSYKHKHGLTRHLTDKHILDRPEQLSALEGLSSEAEQDDIHVLNNVQDIIDSGQLHLQVNSQHLREAQLLQTAQDTQNSSLNPETLHTQASILNGISHIIQSTQGEITQVHEEPQPMQGAASSVHNSTHVDGSKVVSQIVKQYEIISDSQVMEHPEGLRNQDECVLTNQVIQHPNVAMTSLPVAQFFEITTSDVTGEIQTAQ